MSEALPILACIAAVVGWLGLALLSRDIKRNPRGDVIGGLAWRAARALSRVVHRVRIEGAENVPAWQFGDAPVGPLIVVSNHTAGVDPVLIQEASGLDIRWMMMRSMMPRILDGLWAWLQIIPVEKDGRDTTALRESLRHLKSGGVLGVFAEGGLERPPGAIMPYQPGVGLLVLKSGASVLPVVVRDTPRCESAYASLLIPSRTVVRFLPVREYAGAGKDAAGIARDLEEQAARELGWPRTGRVKAENELPG